MDLETVDMGSIISLEIMLDKTKKTGMGFYELCMVHKALGLMVMGPHKATEGELERELLSFLISCKSVFIPVSLLHNLFCRNVSC